jgi:hypothetical protein
MRSLACALFSAHPFALNFLRSSFHQVILAAVGGAADEQQAQGRVARVFERVCRAARDEDGVARGNFARLPGDRHAPAPFEQVVHLFRLHMMMPPDGCARRQHFFRQTAQLDFGRGAIDERAYLRPVRRPDDGGLLAIDDDHNPLSLPFPFFVTAFLLPSVIAALTNPCQANSVAGTLSAGYVMLQPCVSFVRP